jgi:hypothetical protein
MMRGLHYVCPCRTCNVARQAALDRRDRQPKETKETKEMIAGANCFFTFSLTKGTCEPTVRPAFGADEKKRKKRIGCFATQKSFKAHVRREARLPSGDLQRQPREKGGEKGGGEARYPRCLFASCVQQGPCVGKSARPAAERRTGSVGGDLDDLMAHLYLRHPGNVLMEISAEEDRDEGDPKDPYGGGPLPGAVVSGGPDGVEVVPPRLRGGRGFERLTDVQQAESVADFVRSDLFRWCPRCGAAFANDRLYAAHVADPP